MKNLKKLIALLLALTMVLALCACGQSKAPAEAPSTESETPAGAPAEEGDIVIGFLGWSSGVDALYGLVPQYLMQTYFDELNAAGGLLGRQVKFIPYDVSGVGADFSEAVNCANKLIEQGAVAILGPSNSAQGVSVAEICNNAGIVHIPSSSAQLVTVDENGVTRPYTFRCAPEASESVKTLANYAYYELGNPRIAILYETTLVDCVAMYEAFEAEYKAIGGTISDVATYQTNDSEFRAQITKLAQSDPDYILMPAMAYKEIGNMAKQLSELGYADDIKVLTTQVADSEELAEIAGKELEGALYVTSGDINNPAYDAIKEKFNENWGDTGYSVHMAGLNSFNAAYLITHAIESAGSTDPDAICKALEEMGEVEIATGMANGYDEKHNMQGIQFYIKGFQGGKRVDVATYTAPAK